MDGLAGSVAQPQQGDQEALLQEIIQLLMKGVSPDELVAQGVPQELVAKAVQIVLAEQEQAPVEQVPSTPSGLAATQAQGV